MLFGAWSNYRLKNSKDNKPASDIWWSVHCPSSNCLSVCLSCIFCVSKLQLWSQKGAAFRGGWWRGSDSTAVEQLLWANRVANEAAAQTWKTSGGCIIFWRRETERGKKRGILAVFPLVGVLSQTSRRRPSSQSFQPSFLHLCWWLHVNYNSKAHGDGSTPLSLCQPPKKKRRCQQEWTNIRKTN